MAQGYRIGIGKVGPPIVIVASLALLNSIAHAQTVTSRPPGAVEPVLKTEISKNPNREVLHFEHEPDVEQVLSVQRVQLQQGAHSVEIYLQNRGTLEITAVDFVVDATYSDGRHEELLGGVDFLPTIAASEFLRVSVGEEPRPGATVKVDHVLPSRVGNQLVGVTAFPIALVLEDDTAMGDRKAIARIVRARRDQALRLHSQASELNLARTADKPDGYVRDRIAQLRSAGRGELANFLSNYVLRLASHDQTLDQDVDLLRAQEAAAARHSNIKERGDVK